MKVYIGIIKNDILSTKFCKEFCNDFYFTETVEGFMSKKIEKI